MRRDKNSIDMIKKLVPLSNIFQPSIRSVRKPIGAVSTASRKRHFLHNKSRLTTNKQLIEKK
jgi:hypothetical protein